MAPSSDIERHFTFTSSSNTDFDSDIPDDIGGNTQTAVSGFATKYFANAAAPAEGDELHHLSTAPAIDRFVTWFLDFTSQISSDGGRVAWRQVTQQPAQRCTGTPVVQITAGKTLTHINRPWRDAQVIGFIDQDEAVDHQHGLFHLCGLARQVFVCQPGRLFLHGFYIYRSYMEPWIFDRSGMYSCNPIDIRSDFQFFTRLVRSYQLMSDDELGKSKCTRSDETGMWLTLDDAALASIGDLQLSEHPLATTHDIFGGGTTCFAARPQGSEEWEYAVKFKWMRIDQQSESAMLETAQSHGVWGIVSLHHHIQLDKTSELRRGLQFVKYSSRKASHEQVWRDGLTGSCLTHAQTADQEAMSDMADIVDDTSQAEELYQDRVLTCVITSPVGKSLRNFESLTELLLAIRDAVRAHQSLLERSNLLHQDCSAANIIITKPKNDGDPKGMLIDFDVAKDISKEPPQEGTITGTKPFLALGVLKKHAHSYRHDLESFFYVILWMGVTNGSHSPPQTSNIKLWSRGSYEEATEHKMHHMRNISMILDEFVPRFQKVKRLVETLHTLLFNPRNGEISIETNNAPGAMNALYGDFIAALNRSIASLNEQHP